MKMDWRNSKGTVLCVMVRVAKVVADHNEGISHGYFRIFLHKRISTFQFCLPVFLEIHRQPKQKEVFQMLWCIFEKNPIHPLWSAGLGWSVRHFLDKVTWWHFQSTLKEVIWPQIFWITCMGLKVPQSDFNPKLYLAPSKC